MGLVRREKAFTHFLHGHHHFHNIQLTHNLTELSRRHAVHQAGNLFLADVDVHHHSGDRQGVHRHDFLRHT